MKISALAVRNPQLTLLFFAMLVVLGITSFRRISRSEDPQFPHPIFMVLAVYPGASAEDLEEIVAKPVEDAVMSLDHLDHVRSSLRDGVADVWIEFEAGVDIEAKYQEVQRELDRIRGDLPSGVRRFEIRRARTTEVNVLELALVSETATYHTLSQLGESLERRLERVRGVQGANVWGAPEREVRVELDLPRLAQLGIPPARVLAALESDNVNVPSGSIDAGRRRFSVSSSARYRTVEDVRRTVVSARPEGIVHLGDVATVELGYEPESHVTRYDGKRAVFVTMQLAEKRNIFAVRDAAFAELDRFERQLPAGVTLVRAYDQARNVAHRLDRLYKDFAFALVLVLITLVPLGLRASALVMISIPLSLATGLVGLDLFGFGINQLSIVGFVIALGLVVDDSIVVVENIARFLREGRSRLEAAIEATQQIGLAVVGCTATLILAFVPLIFLPGSSGNFIRSLPMAVMFAVLGSLVVSLTIVPYLASRIMPRGEAAHENVFLRVMNAAIEGSYAKVLKKAVARPKTTLALTAVVCAASFALVPRVGFSLFPPAGIPQFLVEVETSEGATLAETDAAVRFAEGVLRRHPEVRTVFSNVGRGNPFIYYNVAQHLPAEEYGELFVLLHAYDPRTTPALFDRLRRELSEYRAATFRVREFQNGPPIEAPVAVRVYAEDLDDLARAAAAVEATLRDTPGTRDVHNPLRNRRTGLRLEIDRDRAGMLGIPTAEIARTARLGIAGLEVGTLQEASGDSYDIRVRLASPERPTLEALSRVYVSSLTGAQVPLSQVTTLPFTSAQALLQRRNGSRMTTLTAWVKTGANTNAVTRNALARIDALSLPASAHVEPAGEVESRNKSFDGLGTAVVIALFLVLAVLVLEFRTFRSTLVVATVLPLGVLGGLLGLYLTGYTLSFTAAIGFIALIGIEIKTSILLVDLTNQLREEGLALDDAVMRAGELRFLPIVLTALTAIGGLVPLALEGSALYSPLAVVIIGGLVSSTLLARVVTPAAYKLLAPATDRARSAGPMEVGEAEESEAEQSDAA